MDITNISLPIQLDFQQKIPLSEQIAERVRRLIQAGVLKPGQPLPTVRQLAFQLGVNFNTVARAYRALDAEGLIITWQGRGSFVEQPQEIVEIKDISAARQLIDNLFLEASGVNISEQEIWDALAQRQKDHPTSESSKGKKYNRHRVSNKLNRRIIGWKLTNRKVKRRIALHGVKQNAHKRIEKSRRLLQDVSRETLTDK